MEKTFTIRWDDDLGQDWMNKWSLLLCLFSEEHIGGEAKDKVEVEEIKPNIPQDTEGGK